MCSLLYGHRLMNGNHAEWQHIRGYSRRQEHDAVDAMEGFTSQHQTVEHIEHRQEHSHLQVVYQKLNHHLIYDLRIYDLRFYDLLFSIWSMSSRSSSTEIFSSLTKEETAER